MKLQLSRAIAGAVFSRLASAQSSSPSSSPSSSFPLVGEKYWERDCGEGGSSGASGDASGSVIIETAHVGELGVVGGRKALPGPLGCLNEKMTTLLRLSVGES